eukprot:561689-Amphidinium_carterae.1
MEEWWQDADDTYACWPTWHAPWEVMSSELPAPPSDAVCLVLDTACQRMVVGVAIRRQLESSLQANLSWHAEQERFTFGAGGSLSQRRNVMALRVPGSTAEIATSFSEVPCRIPLLASRPWLET